VALTDTKERTAEAATLKSLKRDLENEKRASAELRESVRRLQDAVTEMQAEFAKQLGQAQSKFQAAEEALSDQSIRLEALGEGREDTIKTLQQTQEKLSVVKSERDQLLRRLTTVEGMQTETVVLSDDADSDSESDAPSIDQLMASLSDMMEDEGRGRLQAGRDDASGDGPQNDWQEMLAPELIAPEAFAAEEESPIQALGARLLVFLDADRPIKYPLFKKLITIGRAETADIQIDGDFISRVHARVLSLKDETAVEDAGSKNGIKVNGELVTRRVLKHGDVLGIGRLRFTFIDASFED
jgi:hypothetical protein